MILKQSFKNHFIVSEFTLSMTLILIGTWWYFDYDNSILIIGGLFHLLFSIPAIFLHIQYSIRNAGEEIEISHNQLIVKKNGNESRYNFNELSKIIVYKPASLDKGGMPFSAIEYYRYARIITKSGEEIIISCLMTLDLEAVVKLLSGLSYERKKRIAFLFWK